MELCKVCGKPMRQIPAGISKAGKPYSAFMACPDRCKQPKSFATSSANVLYSGSNSTLPTYVETKVEPVDWDKVSWGKCKYGFLVELLKKSVTLEEAEPIAETWASAAMRRSPSNELGIEEPPFDYQPNN